MYISIRELKRKWIIQQDNDPRSLYTKDWFNGVHVKNILELKMFCKQVRLKSLNNK